MKSLTASLLLALGMVGCSAHQPQTGVHEDRITYLRVSYESDDDPQEAGWCAKVFKNGPEWESVIESARFGPDRVDPHFFASESDALTWTEKNWCRTEPSK